MDDATAAITKDETVAEILKESKISIDRLHEARPYHDISIKNETAENKPSSESSKPNPITENETVAGKNPSQRLNAPTENNPKPNVRDSSIIETVFEKMNITNEKADSTTDSRAERGDIKAANDTLKTTGENKSQSKTAVPYLNFEIKGQLSESQRENLTAGSADPQRSAGNLYSVQGTPSGRMHRMRDSNSNVFPAGCMGCKEDIPLEVKSSPRRFLDASAASQDYAGHLDNTPRKRPPSGRQEIQRNPLTGEGMEPTESRRQMIRRKDGNPVLGTGYDEPANTHTTNRVPPGGYSKGLW